MTKLLRVVLFTTMLAFVSGFAECYKPVTKNQLPSRIKTVAVPAFQMESRGLRYKIESRFTDAVMKELERRGHVVERVKVNGGGYQGILIDPKTSVLHGGSEARKDGAAVGY